MYTCVGMYVGGVHVQECVGVWCGACVEDV